MRRFAITAVLLLAGCGGQSASVPSPSPSAAPGPRVPAAETDTAPVGALGIALEGDVAAVSQTEYRSTGPEIRCSAMLMADGEPQPVATEVEWLVEPAAGGVFSSGAHGVFFVPEGPGRVEIQAALKSPDGRETRSPKVYLTVP